MWERIREIVRKEIIQTLRDPRMRALLFGPPLLQLIIFGYAVNLDVQNARLAWMDQDRTPESRALLAEFQGGPYFRVVALPQSDEDVRNLMDRGSVDGVVRVLPGFAHSVRRGRTAAVQVLVDGTNSNTGAIVSNYAAQVVTRYTSRRLEEQKNARLLAAGSAAPAEEIRPPVTLEPRVWFNPDLQSRDYFVPGIIVNIIALVTVMLTAMSIVREKEIGTMEQLLVTPIRPVELMLGKMLPFGAIGLAEVALITAAALLVFNTPLRGSPALLFGCAVLFLMTTLGVGLFLSTVSDTQQQAMMASFLFFMPAMLLSGFAFPIRNMPVPVQWLTYINPLRYYMEIVRGIFLKGTGMAALWPQMLALLAFGLLILGLSSLRFHKRLE